MTPTDSHGHEQQLLLRFAVKQLQVLDHSLCWVLEKMPEEPHRKSIPTQREFLKLLAAAGSEERPLLLILVHTLARIDEILRLTWPDVNLTLRTVTLWTRKRKGGNLEPRVIPMNDDLFRVMSSMWARREQDQRVFWNAKAHDRFNRRPKLMPSLCRRAGIPHYGFHAIRHFVAIYLHDIRKVSTGVIGDILGHKSKRTTESICTPIMWRPWRP